MHRAVGVAQHGEQPAAALPVGAGPGLHLARRPVVRRVAGRAPRAPVGDRAVAAARVGGRADQGAELHDARPTRSRRSASSVGQHAPAATSRSARVTDGRRELDARDRPREHPAHVGVEHDVPPAVARRSRSRPRCSRRRRAAPRRSSYDAGTSPSCRSTIAVGRGVQPQRPSRVAEPAPGAHRLAGRLGGQVGRASASAPATRSCTGSTRATGVCWSMNSETITDHGEASGAAPGQVARVVVVPREHAARAGRSCARHGQPVSVAGVATAAGGRAAD